MKKSNRNYNKLILFFVINICMIFVLMSCKSVVYANAWGPETNAPAPSRSYDTAEPVSNARDSISDYDEGKPKNKSDVDSKEDKWDCTKIIEDGFTIDDDGNKQINYREIHGVHNCSYYTEYHTVYTHIEGFVIEDTDNSSETMASNSIKPVPGVLVAGNYVTDRTGYYCIWPDDYNNGVVTLDFENGKLFTTGKDGSEVSIFSLDPSLSVADVLKYNGYDYFSCDLPTGNYLSLAEETNMIHRKIVESGKYACQFYLAIDISSSMLDKVTINGVEKMKIEAVRDAAKELVNKLFDSGNNIYVGIVVFAKESKRLAGLTQNQSYLLGALDTIVDLTKDNNCGSSTNLVSAFNKVSTSFENNDPNTSNRSAIFLSDFWPTTDGSTTLYYEDSDEECLRKIDNAIIPNSKSAIQSFLNSGVSTKALVIDDDSFTVDIKQYVQQLIANLDPYISSDFEQIIKELANEIPNWVLDMVPKINGSYTDTTFKVRGREDSARREQVDSYFDSTFYYNVQGTDKLSHQSSIFEEINKIYPSEITDRTKEFSEKTYMITHGSSTPYHIEELPGITYDIESTKCSVCEQNYVSSVTAHIPQESWYRQDLHLKKMPDGALFIKVVASAIRITLNDGTILSDVRGSFEDTTPVIQVIDEEIARGATLEIEYTIQVRTNSAFQFNHLEVVDYIPKDLVYSADSDLITESGKNSSYFWHQESLEKLCSEGYISEAALKKYSNSCNAIVFKVDNSGLGENGFYISKGGNYTSKVVLSKVISSASDIDGYLKNEAEILGYSNTSNRRATIDQVAVEFNTTSSYKTHSKSRATVVRNGTEFIVNNAITGTSYTWNSRIASPPKGDTTVYSNHIAELLANREVYDTSVPFQVDLPEDQRYILGNNIGIYPGDTKEYSGSVLQNIQTVLPNEILAKGVDYASSLNNVYLVPPTGKTKSNTSLIKIIVASGILLSIAISRKIYKKNH